MKFLNSLSGASPTVLSLNANKAKEMVIDFMKKKDIEIMPLKINDQII